MKIQKMFKQGIAEAEVVHENNGSNALKLFWVKDFFLVGTKIIPGLDGIQEYGFSTVAGLVKSAKKRGLVVIE